LLPKYTTVVAHNSVTGGYAARFSNVVLAPGSGPLDGVEVHLPSYGWQPCTLHTQVTPLLVAFLTTESEVGDGLRINYENDQFHARTWPIDVPLTLP